MNRQTLQLLETVLGKDHPDTLKSMMSLANSLDRQGKYAEAEAMNRLRAVTQKKRISEQKGTARGSMRKKIKSSGSYFRKE
ncbi:hypothetical protein F5882DRAFT_423240 [Hyaloscypha sp. PMI_1271]|nr:hypothetical protein F5882DRAFT_423240 [Hyaloscypha sp. PMI_1271]